jgi:hypothetical protein
LAEGLHKAEELHQGGAVRRAGAAAADMPAGGRPFLVTFGDGMFFLDINVILCYFI